MCRIRCFARDTLLAMGVPLTTHRISVEEYLSTPEYDHSEYVGGEVVDLNVGTRDHSIIQKRCARRLDEYADAHPRMFFGTEAHCRLSIADEVRYRLLDVALIVDDDQPHERYINRAPDLAVEIKSPEDMVTAQFAKFSDYFAMAVRSVGSCSLTKAALSCYNPLPPRAPGYGGRS